MSTNQELFSFTKGDPANPAVVLVHGILGSARNLSRLADTLAVEGYFVVAYDQRGHGRSFHGPAKDYTLDHLADDLFKVLDTHGVKSAHLVGHSMGGRVCLRATIKNQSRVDSLAMLDVGVRIHPLAYETIKNIVETLPDSFRNRQEAEKALQRYGPQVQAFLLSNLRTQDERLHWVFDYSGIRTNLLLSLTLDQAEQFRYVECPILVARGENSEHFTTEEMIEIERMNPNVRVTVVPSAGHWLHADNFEGTKEAILNFLRSSDRVAAGA